MRGHDAHRHTSDFRRVLGHWVTGVAVITAQRPGGGEPCGLTANTLTSVSLQPPLVLVCVESGADSHGCIQQAGSFAVNVLAADQERLARRFAAWDLERKYQGVAYHPAVTGAPILDDALAWVDCRVWATYPAGGRAFGALPSLICKVLPLPADTLGIGGATPHEPRRREASNVGCFRQHG
ncbi:MAG: flavin reductase family protein [Gemmatimonadetes bacterium]|nr:flavin reductase family protein [Gemmatimonadota bacterium]